MQAIKPDTDYSIEQFTVFNDRQTSFYLHRTERAVFEAVQRLNGNGPLRLLDVGCGLGMQAGRLALRGWKAYGIDASDQMMRLGQYRFYQVHKKVRFTRGIAEALPFRSASFDVVMCQGAMDHFADRDLFVSEVARVLKPGGYLIVALANYESISCRIGKAMHNVSRAFHVETPRRYQFWRIPADHTFVGSYRLLTGIGNRRLRLARVSGVSMFLFLPPWRELLDALPLRASAAVFRVVDRLAARLPSAADVVVATLQKEELSDVPLLRPDARDNEKRRSSAAPAYLLRR
ncbi:MAG: methyltransferase domain-containing protein [Dehalococcoidia bacterium]|jgi:ubiquinone/menaquinone biosynthesis C-methylase UbiE